MSGRKTPVYVSSASKRPNTSQVSRKLAQNPEFKKVLVPASVDSEFECDLTYCAYIQSLFLREYSEKATNGYKQVLNDQLSLKNDSLFKLQQKCKEENDKSDERQKLKEMQQVLDCLQDSIETVEKLKQDSDLDKNLHDLHSILHSFCNRIRVKNIKVIEKQEDYDELMILVEDCLKRMQLLKNSGRDFEKCNKLAENLRKFADIKQSVEAKTENLTKLQEWATEMWLKETSDMFSKRMEGKHQFEW